MRAFKSVAYPLAGMMQFYLATKQQPNDAILFVLLGVALIAIGILNLHKLTHGGSK